MLAMHRYVSSCPLYRILVFVFLFCCRCVASTSSNLSSALVGDFIAYEWITDNSSFTPSTHRRLLKQSSDGSFLTYNFGKNGEYFDCGLSLNNSDFVIPFYGILNGVKASYSFYVRSNATTLLKLDDTNDSAVSFFCDETHQSIYAVDYSVKNAVSNIYEWKGLPSNSSYSFVATVNGEVTSLRSWQNGYIVVGGNFTRLSPYTKSNPEQLVETTLTSATAYTSSSYWHNISALSCDLTEPSYRWILSNTSSASMRASFTYPFTPSRLRIFFSSSGLNRPTTLQLTASSGTSPVTLSYLDDSSNAWKNCSIACPVNQTSTAWYQDFYLAQSVSSAAFTASFSNNATSMIEIGGMTFFQEDIIVYADNDLNDDNCDSDAVTSYTAIDGDWTSVNSSTYPYYVTSSSDSNSTVSFFPNITYSVNTSVSYYVPSCLNDGSCKNRSRVAVDVYYASGQQPVHSVISLETKSDGYVPVYTGYMQGMSTGFKPWVAVTALDPDRMVTTMAMKFELHDWVGTPGGLAFLQSGSSHGIYTLSDVSSQNITQGASITDLSTCIGCSDELLFLAGRFNSKDHSILALHPNLSLDSISNGGLNAAVHTAYSANNVLYVGGEFTSSSDGKVSLKYAASYNLQNSSWQSLGQGANGAVTSIQPLTLAVNGQEEMLLAFSGNFTNVVNADGVNILANGFAVWNSSSNVWLRPADLGYYFSGDIHNLNTLGDEQLLVGSLTEFMPNVSYGLIGTSKNVQSKSLVGDFQKSLSPGSQLLSAAYPFSGGSPLVIAGHFATDTNISNIAFLIGEKNLTMTTSIGIDKASNISDVCSLNYTLFIFGNIVNSTTQTQRGMALYDLIEGSFDYSSLISTLSGDVNTHLAFNDTTSMLIAGNVTESTSQCRDICVLNLTSSSWESLDNPFTKSNITSLVWLEQDKVVLAGGTFTLNGSTSHLQVYNFTSHVWSTPSLAESLRGPPTHIATITAAQNDTSNNAFIAYGLGQQNASRYFVSYSENSTTDISSNLLLNASVVEKLMYLKADYILPKFSDEKLLLALGNLTFSDGSVSSLAYYRNQKWYSLLRTVDKYGTPGSLRRIAIPDTSVLAIQVQTKTPTLVKYMNKQYIIMVSLASSMGTMFLIIWSGIILDKLKDLIFKQEGSKVEEKKAL
ncbi:cell polarity factor Rax2 [Schizosaccharomyces japonicus yFS275]|uniref:Cell polarity factor Rax2 n=1 Tax=Schizosaccharomyces japonicus (strain yFS275 / FY16936) TaxID=402676 RepID=B6JXS7_SCHJY|nr:cell polarity factor Rax2 [Schizosaccharomyces japonicus yFS275]EEB06345.2 cell polarity factor Rax2 [Schizosaccharomyces japonicus yFS275]